MIKNKKSNINDHPYYDLNNIVELNDIFPENIKIDKK